MACERTGYLSNLPVCRGLVGAKSVHEPDVLSSDMKRFSIDWLDNAVAIFYSTGRVFSDHHL